MGHCMMSCATKDPNVRICLFRYQAHARARVRARARGCAYACAGEGAHACAHAYAHACAHACACGVARVVSACIAHTIRRITHVEAHKYMLCMMCNAE